MSHPVRVSLPTSFAADDVIEFLARDDVVSYWLGDEGVLDLEVGTPAALPRAHRSGRGIAYDAAASARVTSSGWVKHHYELVLAWTATPAADPDAGVRILVTPRPGGSYVRIIENGCVDADAAYAALRVWQGALNRLHRVLREGEHRRNRVRQAVVVVHGIGEQRPGQTLRTFVDGVFPEASGQVRYAKPDYVSPLFEMRTFSVPGDQVLGRPTTDVYELYWAHLIRDTSLGQVYSWMLRLFMAPKRQLPQTLRRHVWTARTVLVLVAATLLALVVTGKVETWSAALAAGALAFLPGLLWGFWKAARNTLLLAFAGDAARYLEPKPDNIERRQQIREAGVDLLNALHDGQRYDRIIVYGHSLGSVIAYDILRHAWTRRSRQLDGPVPVMACSSLVALEDVLNPRPGVPATDPADVPDLQHAAWREHRRNGFTWLVTDFVTAGSPLAHARWLLNADKRTSFDDLVRDRAFPTCPPVTEQARTPTPGRTRESFTYTFAYPDDRDESRSRSTRIPHHAALFALTRWSNLYFPLTGVTHGDPVGGPLHDTFGAWVDDIPLKHPGGGVGGFAHTYYTAVRGDGEHLDRLREALKLEFPTRLDELITGEVASAHLG